MACGSSGDRPAVVVLVPVVGLLDVVASELVALHLEEVLGVAHVLEELLGHLVAILDRVGEGAAPRLEERVVLVPRVEHDLAGVGVDGGLDGVAHVVDLVGRQRLEAGVDLERVVDHRVERLPLGVREPVGGGVAVEDPLDPPVDDGRVGVAVDGEPRRDLLDAVLRVALEQHLGAGVDTRSESRKFGSPNLIANMTWLNDRRRRRRRRCPRRWWPHRARSPGPAG